MGRISVVLVAGAIVFSQFNDSSVRGQGIVQSLPRLMMSYNSRGPSCELGAALDSLVAEMAQTPYAYCCIVIHRAYNNPPSFFHNYDPPGLFSRHSIGVRNYLTEHGKILGERIEIVEGGMREQFQVEIWLLAKHGTIPESNPAINREVVGEPREGLFDEYIYDPDSDLASYFGSPGRLEGFAKALSDKPDAQGYVIGYGQCLDITETTRVKKNGKEVYATKHYQQRDRSGTGRRIGQKEKNDLARTYSIAPGRVTVKDGGYRGSEMIELWMVPVGGRAPESTPTERCRERR